MNNNEIEEKIKKQVFQMKVKRFGGSYMLIIPKNVRELLKLNEADIVEVTISKIEDIDTMKKYKCSYCDCIFHSDDEIPFCPNCGKEDCILEVIERRLDR